MRGVEPPQEPSETDEEPNPDSPAPLPRSLLRDVTRIAKELAETHSATLNADPHLKERAARLLRSLLPPKKKPGRPALSIVTAADRIFRRHRQDSPDTPAKDIWRLIYPQVFPHWNEMTPDERSREAERLRTRLRSRRNARARRANRRRSARE